MNTSNSYYSKYLKYKIKYLDISLRNKSQSQSNKKQLFYQSGGKQFSLQSNTIKDGEEMNDKYTSYYDNIQPDIEWEGVPDSTKELLLLCYDPDAIKSTGKTWIHWIVSGIDPTTNTLVDGKYTNDLNSFGHKHYDGPKPPHGSGVHHYHFKLFALNKELTSVYDLNKEYTYDEIINLLHDNKLVIDQTEIVATYTK